MLTRARSESGVTVVELLVGLGLLMVVMISTITALDAFGRTTADNYRQNHAQSIARTAIDRMARELRGTASPGLPNSPVERAGSNELVFQTVDPTSAGSGSNTRSVERVRYCLDSSSKLWKQIQTWTTATPPAVSTTTTCPHSSYGSQATVADYVVNQANSQNRSVFTYDAASASDVTAVTVELFTDTSLTQPPGEQRLSTTVFLRNENRPPTASFSATPIGKHHLLLNASASQDPDGDELTYTWYDGSTQIGTGAILDYGSPTGGNHDISVNVADPSGLSTTSATQTVSVN